ncbi:MAG: Na+/H+ antiporter subunit E [Microthrixaceae bacterium]
MRSLGRIAVLTLLWMFAWGAFSGASILSGLAVSTALLALFPPGRDPGLRLRPIGAVRLVAHVVGQLVTSNLVMTVQTLRRRPALRQGVVTHRLGQPSAEVVTLMTTIIALSPGTMVVDVSPDSAIIHVHVLNLADVEATRRSLERLERLVAGAISPRTRHRHEVRLGEGT